MRGLRLELLSTRARFGALSAVLLTLVGIVFAADERGGALGRATSAHEAALAVRLSSARPPPGLAAGRLPRRATRALDRALGDLASARGSLRLFNRDRELVYSGDGRAERSPAGSSAALEAGLRGRVGSVRVAGSSGGQSDQLETVIPLRSEPAGSTVGAFAVRRPWQAVAARADFPSWEGLVPMVGALALAWAGMLAAVSVVLRGARSGPRRLSETQLDPLTGLLNRATFRDLLSKGLAAAKRGAGDVSVIVLDLDRFKEINDTLGHFNGDMLLKRIGPRLTTVLRDQDTVARLAGDEFAILLPGLSDRTAIAAAAKRITGAFTEPFVLGGLAIEIEASLGIAVGPEHGDRVDVLLQRADMAMYAAKSQRSGYAFYSDEHAQGSRRRLALAGELRRAIAEDEIVVWYQPKARLATNEIVGVEALARWVHPTRGIISPAEFVPIAEQTNLIHPLTERVLERALEQVRDWHARGFKLTMAVNLSTRNLVDAGLPDQIANLLRRWGVDPAYLELELTESMLMSDPRRAKGALSRLREVGARLNVDDFGTGYSSLAYLKDLPVDAVKIDKSFVMEMESEPRNAAIVRSTVDLGRNLGLDVIAEGVETQGAYDELVGLGCDYAQGYLLARPLPPHELLARVQEIAQAREAATPPRAEERGLRVVPAGGISA